MTKFKALAMLSSDALSSVAYGTEQITTVLVTLFDGRHLVFLTDCRHCFSSVVSNYLLSYRQIIHAIRAVGAPTLSPPKLVGNNGLIAGGSLLVDYMLTVAVSTTSGTEAITSAIPFLYNYSVHISVVIVLIIMFMNLRG